MSFLSSVWTALASASGFFTPDDRECGDQKVQDQDLGFDYVKIGKEIPELDLFDLYKKNTIVLGPRRSGKTTLLLDLLHHGTTSDWELFEKPFIMSRYDTSYYEKYGTLVNVCSRVSLKRAQKEADGVVIDNCIYKRTLRDKATYELFLDEDTTVVLSTSESAKIPYKLMQKTDYIILPDINMTMYKEEIFKKWIRGMSFDEFYEMIEENTKNYSFLIFDINKKKIYKYRPEKRLFN